MLSESFIMSQPFTSQSNFIKTVTITGDLILLNLSFMATYFMYHDCVWDDNFTTFLPLVNLCYVCCLSVFKVQLHKRIIDMERIVSRLFTSVTAFIILFIFSMQLMHVYTPNKFIFIYYPILLTLIISWRISMRYIVKMYRRKGRNSITAVIVGSKSNMVELYNTMTNDPAYGFRINGIFDDDETLKNFPKGAVYLGKVADVIPYLEKSHVNSLFCCLPSAREAEILPIINFCENNMVHFFSVPNVRSYLRRKMKLELMGDTPVMYIRNEPLQQIGNKILKRSFDFIVSSIFLCTLYPFIYIIVGAIIKLTSPGPVYFKQDRSGEEGKVFKCIKFRSMKVNSASDELQATKNDPRKTRFGEFIRHTNIDELPQFINVWKGEMSIVGPRPHMLKHTEEYRKLINKYMVRHLCKPGITGWAQVTGYRGETKELNQMEGRVRKDIWYIENWSFILDLRIIFMTVFNAIRGDKKAY